MATVESKSTKTQRATDDPARVAAQRLAFQERQTRNVRQLHADARPGRRAVSRHHRLRRHRHPGNQPRPDRRARHALPRREGPGQEPADAAARPASSTKSCPISTSPAAPCTKIPTTRSPALGKQLLAEMPDDRGAHRLVAARAALCRAAGAGHQVRRHHRRDRSRRSWPPARACRPKRRCTSA